MKKIFNMLMLSALCQVVVCLSSCKMNDEDIGCVLIPAPEKLELSGIITNEDGQSLAAIQISIDDTKLERNEYDLCIIWSWDSVKYTNRDGGYKISFEYGGDPYSPTAWPSELTVIAKDTTGIYETDTKTVSVNSRYRYPDDAKYGHIIDGSAIADFVLHKREQPSDQKEKPIKAYGEADR